MIIPPPVLTAVASLHTRSYLSLAHFIPLVCLFEEIALKKSIWSCKTKRLSSSNQLYIIYAKRPHGLVQFIQLAASSCQCFDRQVCKLERHTLEGVRVLNVINCDSVGGGATSSISATHIPPIAPSLVALYRCILPCYSTLLDVRKDVANVSTFLRVTFYHDLICFSIISTDFQKNPYELTIYYIHILFVYNIPLYWDKDNSQFAATHIITLRFGWFLSLTLSFHRFLISSHKCQCHRVTFCCFHYLVTVWNTTNCTKWSNEFLFPFFSTWYRLDSLR